MVISVAVSTILLVISVVSHVQVIAIVRHVLPDIQNARVLPRVSAILIVSCSHLWTAALFAAGFGFGEMLGIGGFDPSGSLGWMDLFNYSVINMTTLGLGDVRPTGHLRFMAGIESLTGFILISCTAQYVYSAMERGPKRLTS